MKQAQKFLCRFKKKNLYNYLFLISIQDREGYCGENKKLDKLCIGGGASDMTTLGTRLSNCGRKGEAGVVKRNEAGVEKSRNRTHCGVEAE